jgi:hypothetical protein
MVKTLRFEHSLCDHGESQAVSSSIGSREESVPPHHMKQTLLQLPFESIVDIVCNSLFCCFERRKSEKLMRICSVSGFLSDTDIHLCHFELFSVALCCSLQRWLIRVC